MLLCESIQHCTDGSGAQVPVSQDGRPTLAFVVAYADAPAKRNAAATIANLIFLMLSIAFIVQKAIKTLMKIMPTLSTGFRLPLLLANNILDILDNIIIIDFITQCVLKHYSYDRKHNETQIKKYMGAPRHSL